MNSRWIQLNVIGLITSSLVLISILYILDHPIKLVFSLIIATLTFLLYKYLSSEDDKILMLKIMLHKKLRYNYVYYSIIFIHFFSIVIVMLVPSIAEIYYIDWFEIPFINLLRLISAILLLSFFPGYVIFSFIKKRRAVGIVGTFVFSFFLSLFVVPLTIFILASLNLTSHIYKQTILLLNFLLLLLYSSDFIRRKVDHTFTNKKADDQFKIPVYRFSILFCLFLFIIIGSYGVTLGNPYQAGDQWQLIGRSLQFLKGSFPEINGHAVPFYAWWYDLYLSSFFVISGLPFLNVYGSLSFLSVLPSMTFYLLLSQIYNRKSKHALLGTVLYGFLGFGWVYYLNEKLIVNPATLNETFKLLNLVGNKTYDLWRGIFLIPIEGIRPIYVIGYPTLFTLIYLLVYIGKKSFIGWSDSFFITILIAVSYLGYPLLVLVFTSLYFMMVLFRLFNLPTSQKINFATLMGLTLVGIIDYFSPGKFYTVQKSSYGLIPSRYFFLSLIIVISTIFLQYIRPKISFQLNYIQLNNRLINLIMKISHIIVVYIYGLSVIIWIYVYDIYRVSGTNVPWYMYWMRLGVVGVFGVLGTLHFLSEKDRKQYNKDAAIFVLLSLLYFVAIIFGRLSYIISDEARIMFILYVAFIFPATNFIIQCLTKLNLSKLRHHIILAFSLLIIIIAGFSSTILKFEFFSLIGRQYGENADNSYAYVSPEEFEALNYLRINTASNDTIACASINSRAKVTGLAGVSDPQARSSLGWGGDGAETWSMLFSSDSPETVSYLLHSLKIKYIYVALEDVTVINEKYKEGYIAQHLFKFLPIVFNNSEVTIYDVPLISTAASSSNLTLLLSREQETETSQIVDQESTTHSKGSFISTLEFRLAQRFSPYYPNISRISLFIARVGEPNASLTIEIQGDNEGVPNGITYARGYIQETDVKESPSEVTVNITCHNLNTTKYYHIVVYCNVKNLKISSTGYIVYYSQDDVYSRGYRSYFSTNNWIPQDNFDLFFRLWTPIESEISPMQSLKGKWSNIFPLEMIELSGYEHTILHEKDIHRPNSSILVLTYDPSNENDLIEYLEWVKNGGHLIVLNSLGHGAFANLIKLDVTNKTSKSNAIIGTDTSFPIPEISIPCFSSRMEDVVTISNYTYNKVSVSPFALRKEIGMGEITYVEVLPYFSALTNATDNVKRTLFSKLGMFVDALDLPQIDLLSKQSAVINYPYIMSAGVTNLTNNIRIKSSSLFFSDIENYPVKSIDFSELDYLTINGRVSQQNIYYNLTVNDIEVHGSSYSILDSKQVSIGPLKKKLSYGTYVLTQMTSDFNWTLHLSDHTFVTIKLHNQSKSTIEVEFRGGNVKFSFSPSKVPIYLYLNNPYVSVQGEIIIDKANLYTLPYRATVVGGLIQILGNTSFSIDRLDNSYTFMSNINANATIKTIQETVNIYIAIPWKEILSSPLHLFLLVIISLLLFNKRGYY